MYKTDILIRTGVRHYRPAVTWLCIIHDTTMYSNGILLYATNYGTKFC